MNQLAIFYQLLLTSFYVSSALAEDDLEKALEWKLKEVKFYTVNKGEASHSKTFKNVYLYKLGGKIWKNERIYVVGEDSSEVSERFPLYESNTVVTRHMVTIKTTQILITIIANEGPFSFYERFFTLKDFSEQYFVKSVFQGTKILDKAFVIKATEFKSGFGVFVVLNDKNIPLLIFPSTVFELSRKEDNDKGVSVLLQIEPKTVVGIEFDASIDANELHRYLNSFKPPKVDRTHFGSLYTARK